MNKRRPALDPSQLGFTFDAPRPARDAAALIGLDRYVAAGVAQALKDDARTRSAIGFAMAELLGEDVTVFMLDAYASEARDHHNIPLHRALALFAVTERFDIFDHLIRRIGAGLLVGEEMLIAELGHIDRRIAQLKARRRSIETRAIPIERSAPRRRASGER